MPDNYGYDIQKEDRQWLASLPNWSSLMLSSSDYVEQRLDPRELIKVENQGQQGSCQGHALSSCVEWCYTLATNGQVQQLSRAMGYYESQRIDGIRGDSGSTISGGAKLATTVGICEESLWPYPSRYSNNRPSNWDEVTSNAGKYKIARAVRIKTYDEYRNFLGSLQGGINNGISWGGGMNTAIVENFSGSGGGGHAIAGLCLSERVDSQGRPYVWIANSWGENFGSREYPGWQEWSPKAIDQMLWHQWTEMIGLSEMPEVKPRKFTKEDWIKGLRM